MKKIQKLSVAIVLSFLLVVFGSMNRASAKENAQGKVYRVGILKNWPPQYLTDPKTGTPDGFAIDIMNAVAEKGNFKINYLAFDNWQQLNQAGREGKLDMIANMGITEGRLYYYLFTTPYESIRVSLFVRSTANNIKDISDLKNRNIGVVAENIGVDLVNHLQVGYLKSFESADTALFGLLAGSIDALIYPEAPLLKLANQFGLDEHIKTVDEPLLEVKRGIAVIKGKTDLYVLVNKALKEVIASDEYKRIYGKWYQAPKPFWTSRRVMLLVGIIVGLTAVILIIWRFYSMMSLNKQLQQSILEKAEAQTALQESETKFRQLAENIREVLWIVTIDWGKVEYISPAYEDIWGKPCQSLYDNPLSWLDSIVPEDRIRVDDYLAEKRQGNLDHLIFPDYRVLRPDGEIRWIHARGFPIRNEQNEIFRITGIAEDITAQKNSALELQKSMEQVRLLLDHTGEGIYGIDLKGVCTFANPVCVKILGYQSTDELIGKNMHHLIHSKHLDQKEYPEHECKIFKSMQVGEIVHNDQEVFWRSDGSSFPVEYRSAPILQDNTIVGAVVTFVDISERKLAEQQLKTAKKDLEARIKERAAEIDKLSSAVEQSPNVVVITNSDGAVEYVNPKFTATYGYSAEEAIGQKTSILKADNLTREDFRVMWDTIKSGKEWRGELHNLTKSGQRIWQLVSISPVKNQDGLITHFIASQENIDAAKKTEFALHAAMINAEKANQAKSEFLANMSHELRTPLNAIIGFTQLLERKSHGELNEKQMRFFKRIKEAGDHLLQMVNDVLDLSKVEAGKIEIDKRPFNFGQMLIRSPLTIQSIANKRSISIVTNIPDNIGWLVGDETRIKQVIFNLLSNAFKFTESGKKIGIEAETEDDKVSVTVWDQGIGIKEENLEKIFEPFEQVVHGVVPEEGGTGLGLAISRRLVEMHGGTISVTSKFGEGSRFTVVFPGRVESDTDSNTILKTQIPEDSDSMQKPLSILVTEDNEANLQLFEAILEKGKYRLDFARSAEEAIEKCSIKSYDLVLMDIQLPGKTGTQAMKEIKALHGKDFPIIAVTAFAMKGDQEKYLEEGFNAYVSKPISLAALNEAIAASLGNK